MFEIVINETVLDALLDHVPSLLSNLPHCSEHRHSRFVQVLEPDNNLLVDFTALLQYFLLEICQRFQRLDDGVDGNESAGSADSSTAMDYDRARLERVLIHDSLQRPVLLDVLHQQINIIKVIFIRHSIIIIPSCVLNVDNSQLLRRLRILQNVLSLCQSVCQELRRYKLNGEHSR